MQLIPRPYQDRDIGRIKDSYRRKVKRVLYVSACGSGKTVTFTKIAQGASLKGSYISILAHRKELIMQCSDKLNKFDVDHGIIKSGIVPHYDKNIQVASVQTMVHHLDDIAPPQLIIPDEAHHSQNATQQKIIKHYPDALLLGVTASPIFGNGRSLGGYYDELIQGPSVGELVEDGYLVPIRVFAPPPVAKLDGVDYGSDAELEAALNKRRVTGDAIEHYRRLAAGLPAIVYVVSIKHAEDVAEQFRSAGFAFYAIDGTMGDKERDRLLAEFKSGEIEGLVSCDLISEGTDIPRAMVAIKLRPTKSLGLHIQQDGRINRPFYADGMPLDTREQRKAAIAASAKPYGIIIDHVNNLYFHGLPDDEFTWSLVAPPVQKRAGGLLIPIQQCSECFAHFKPAEACPYCGAAVEKKERKLVYTKGQLVEIKKNEVITRKAAIAKKKQDSAEAKARKEAERIQKTKERKAAKTYVELVAFARKWKYDNPEAWAGNWIKMRQNYKGR